MIPHQHIVFFVVIDHIYKYVAQWAQANEEYQNDGQHRCFPLHSETAFLEIPKASIGVTVANKVSQHSHDY
jgi:hypothetical protein